MTAEEEAELAELMDAVPIIGYAQIPGAGGMGQTGPQTGPGVPQFNANMLNQLRAAPDGD
ncbi:MAG: hypothetical protein CYPHOPRED_003359 [Cyphobasidiales sp. Tagirdzhanova-0007]|nr:MAG: hypothetical protein CYPHOPRED_003359 [Cyphobasidiales sp. Tagirdzhanova-0007]